MDVNGILRAKGARVVTIEPDATIDELVRGLREERIGAMVVSRDGRTIEGIVSEQHRKSLGHMSEKELKTLSELLTRARKRK